ncbi:MAG TPA: class I SAM-dependent methyltransferase [Gemmataceae bacterium]|nr:class I SAM-dependent methyltransferase [Gemmataceae bacterium]
MKSSVDEIRARFDQDVERFANLETGQSATVDALLGLELIAEAAAACTPNARRLLDVGCGAGNYSLKLLERLPGLDVTLIDLSRPMLDRAELRLRESSAKSVRAIQGDVREIELGESAFDLIVAAAVLHHLRTDAEWEGVFAKFQRALARGGTMWVFDMMEAELPVVRPILWAHYARYLEGLKGPAYRDHVSPTSRRRTRRGRSSTNSTCCAGSGSRRSRCCTGTRASRRSVP